MKKVILAAALVLFIGSVNAQSRYELQGLKAKNYKPWKAEVQNEGVFFNSNKDKKTSLEVKNTPASKRNKDAELKKVTGNESRKNLKGLKAKNYKPWKQNG